MAQLRRCCGVRFDPHDTPMWPRIKWEGSVLVLFAERFAGLVRMCSRAQPSNTSPLAKTAPPGISSTRAAGQSSKVTRPTEAATPGEKSASTW